MGTPVLGHSSSSYLLSLRGLQLSRNKLKASGRVSALLAGFAMIAIIELQIETGPNKPSDALLASFTALACLLVVVHIIAVMISTCILPHLDSSLYTYNQSFTHEPPHRHLRTLIEIAWIFSTVVGIILFLAVLVVVCWVKFWHISVNASFTGTMVIVPSTVILIIFAILLYKRLVMHKVEQATDVIRTLDFNMSMLDGENKISDGKLDV